MKPLRFGVVGLGRMGRRHARVLSEASGAQLCWTVDPVAPGLANVPHYSRLPDALRAGADAVVIATPTATHAEVAGILIDSDVPVLVEKPIAHTLSDAEELARRAEDRGVLLVVGHVERFNPAVEVVEGLLATGGLGAPLALDFRRVGLPPSSPPDVDVLLDLAVHDLDICAMLCACDPELVGSVTWPPNAAAESAQLLLRAGDVGATVQVNWRTPTRIRRFALTTDECLVEGDYTLQTVEVVERIGERDLEPFSTFQAYYGAGRRVTLEVNRGEPLAVQARAFIEAVATGSRGRLAGAGEGLRALRLATSAAATAAHARLAGAPSTGAPGH